MTAVLAIAHNTFREVIRARVLYILVFFGAGVILLSKAVGWISVGQDIKIITDLGLAAVPFFAVLIAIFVGTTLVYREIDQRTLYTILARPIRRETFILGKYLGLLWAVFLVQTLMLVAFLLYLGLWLRLRGEPDQFAGGVGFSTGLWQACLLMYFEVALVTALAVFFSAVSTPILSAFFTFAAYAVGSCADMLYQIVLFARTAELSPAELERLKQLVYLTASLIPNFSTFHWRDPAAHGQAMPWTDFAGCAAYGALYTALLLVLAALAFRRREL